jgi:SAM-dependent methyltransferase
MRAILQIRAWGARLAYNRVLAYLATNEEWRERMFGSFHLSDSREVLIVGPFSFSSALLFAARNPNVKFCAIEDGRRLRKYARLAQQKALTNVRFFGVPTDAPLPFSDDSFDAIICSFAFHALAPAQKVTMALDLVRVLRMTRRLHVVELTQPQAGQEGMMLGFAGLVWGADAVLPHSDGSWMRLLSQSGFEGAKQDRSFSITVGRLACVSATKRGRKAAASGAKRRRDRLS